MGNLLHDWFPDAPTWVPWLAFYLMVALFLFFLACLVANPLENLRNRNSHKEGKEKYVGVTSSGSLATSVAVSAATGIPPQLVEAVTSEQPRLPGGHRKEN